MQGFHCKQATSEKQLAQVSLAHNWYKPHQMGNHTKRNESHLPLKDNEQQGKQCVKHKVKRTVPLAVRETLRMPWWVSEPMRDRGMSRRLAIATARLGDSGASPSTRMLKLFVGAESRRRCS